MPNVDLIAQWKWKFLLFNFHIGAKNEYQYGVADDGHLNNFLSYNGRTAEFKDKVLVDLDKVILGIKR